MLFQLIQTKIRTTSLRCVFTHAPDKFIHFQHSTKHCIYVIEVQKKNG